VPTRVRPLGVGVVAVLFAFSSFLTFVVLLLGLIQPAWISSLHHIGPDIEAAGNHIGSFLLVGAAYAGLAAGLWRLRNWARLAVLFLAGTSLMLALAGIAVAAMIHRPVAGFFWFSAGLCGSIVIYLRQSHVKAVFRKRDFGPAA
jgi:hypothetical protein